jgi:ATP-binding cassette, subfamily B, bacterial
MPLLEELPKNITNALQDSRDGQLVPPLSVAVKTDIDKNGKMGERWIVVDNEAIRVYSGKNGADLEKNIAIKDIKGAKTESLVGGGALYVQKGSDVIELVRYSSPLGGRMNSVSRTIEALINDKELPPDTIEGDDRLCKKCGRPLPKDNDVCSFCLDKRATFSRLFSYALPYKWHAIGLVALMVAGTSLSIIPGVINKDLTDQVLAPRDLATHPMALRMSKLGLYVLQLLGASIIGLLIGIFRGRLSAFLSARIVLTIRTQIFEQLQKLGLSYFDKRASGAIMTRVTQDVNELNNFLVDGLQFLVVNVLTILGILVVMFRFNWQMTLWILIPVPIVIVATRMIWRFLWRRMERLWHKRSQLGAALGATLNGMRVVKAFAQEAGETTKFNKRVQDLYDINLNLENNWATWLPLLGLIMGSGSYIVWFLGGKDVIGGKMTLGTLNMFFYFLGMLYGPLQGMTRIADWLSRALTSAERVFEVIDTQPDVADAPDSVSMPNIKGNVTFKNVAFSYDKAKRVLEDFDLEVKEGEMIGLVGHSGAGKTTIINMISRFYDPVEGEIFIDGVPMRKIKMQDLRSQMGIVLQEPFLFPGTIAENIAYAKPEASPIEIMRAAKAANAHEFVMRFADGYDTQVGERGVRLSGGERQRLSIARAILHNPRILILDEATASVDTETEKKIQEAIQRLIAGRTTFAIAHRLSTLRNADRLVVIDKGKMAEVGTHDELMQKENGIFRKLVEMQTEINKMRSDIITED